MTAHRANTDDLPRPLRRWVNRLLVAGAVFVALSAISAGLMYAWKWSPMAVRAEAETARQEVKLEAVRAAQAETLLANRIATNEQSSKESLKVLNYFSVLFTENPSSPEYREAVRRLRRMRTLTINP